MKTINKANKPTQTISAQSQSCASGNKPQGHLQHDKKEPCPQGVEQQNRRHTHHQSDEFDTALARKTCKVRWFEKVHRPLRAVE